MSSTAHLLTAAAWEPRRTSVRLVAGLWLLASFIVASVYRSNLKAMLILPRTPFPFTTVNELAATDIPAYVIKGSLIDHAMKVCIYIEFYMSLGHNYKRAVSLISTYACIS